MRRMAEEIPKPLLTGWLSTSAHHPKKRREIEGVWDGGVVLALPPSLQVSLK